MKNILLYWPRFIKEAWYTLKYYKAVKSIEEELNDEGLRVDWIGRIYGIIELKEEFIKQQEIVQQSWVFQQLGAANSILLKYGLSDDAYPEISKINESSYLVVLYPENDQFNLYSFIRNILFAAGVAAVVFGIVQLVNHFV